jgi:hypothetical protein
MFNFFLALSLTSAWSLPLVVAPDASGPLDYAQFIVPNEFDNYLHYNRIAKEQTEIGQKRTVIAVGSLRAFNLAAVLKRDALISLDISAEVSQFNRTLAAVIAVYDRPTFIKAMLGLDLKAHIPLHSRTDFQDALEQAYLSEAAFENPITQLLIDPYRMDAWLESLSEFAQNNQRFTATFFSSDENYLHLQKLIRAGQLSVITGNLAGEQTMLRLAQEMTRSELVVSELDISNALSFIIAHESEGAIHRLKRNIQALPTAPKASLLLTLSHRHLDWSAKYGDPQKGMWHYLVRDLKALDQIPVTRQRSDILRALGQASCTEALL